MLIILWLQENKLQKHFQSSISIKSAIMAAQGQVASLQVCVYQLVAAMSVFW